MLDIKLGVINRTPDKRGHLDRTQGLGNLIILAVGVFKPKPRKIRAKPAGLPTAVKIKKIRQDSGPTQLYPYRAASITFEKCPHACPAVRDIEGQKFLVRNVPTVPVPDCTSRDCECRYARHTDRRGISEDRRSFYSLGAATLFEEDDEAERRLTYGRRDGEEMDIAIVDFDFVSVR